MATRRDAVVRRGLRHVWRSIVEQPRMFGLAVAASSVYGAMTVASAWVIGQITNRVLLPAFAEGATTAAAAGEAAMLPISRLAAAAPPAILVIAAKKSRRSIPSCVKRS